MRTRRSRVTAHSLQLTASGPEHGEVGRMEAKSPKARVRRKGIECGHRVIQNSETRVQKYGGDERTADDADAHRFRLGQDAEPTMDEGTVGQGSPRPMLYVERVSAGFADGWDEEPETRNQGRAAQQASFQLLRFMLVRAAGLADGRLAVFRGQSGPEVTVSGRNRHLQVVSDVSPNHKKAHGGSCPQTTRRVVL
jgi:hypothetical protein